ncbi:MAG: GFA family protein [Novosphingobium sp.]
MIETACRCGAVKLRIPDEPLAQVYCHCRDCQLAYGGAYSPNSIYHADAVEVSGGEVLETAVEATPRKRCAACGTPLFTEVLAANMRSLNAYLLPPGAFDPQFHIHCAEALLPIVDALPHYAALPAAFGGSDECVSW